MSVRGRLELNAQVIGDKAGMSSCPGCKDVVGTSRDSKMTDIKCKVTGVFTGRRRSDVVASSTMCLRLVEYK